MLDMHVLGFTPDGETLTLMIFRDVPVAEQKLLLAEAGNALTPPRSPLKVTPDDFGHDRAEVMRQVAANLGPGTKAAIMYLTLAGASFLPMLYRLRDSQGPADG